MSTHGLVCLQENHAVCSCHEKIQQEAEGWPITSAINPAKNNNTTTNELSDLSTMPLMPSIPTREANSLLYSLFPFLLMFFYRLCFLNLNYLNYHSSFESYNLFFRFDSRIKGASHYQINYDKNSVDKHIQR